LAILFVNTKYTLIDTEVIDHGTVDKIAIYIRELIKKAIEKNAYGIILSHNHPSQDITPSIPDITFTEELNYACNSMSIKLIDHIIIGSYAYYSFKENSVL
ncbi:MAG: JAB domain-containing protein, partial [Anaplasmataceae bacterium]|nr:JAB domain-containing protein [Anaplasmataceae bacterium]